MATTTSVYVDPNTGGVQVGLMNFRNGIINGNFDVWQRGTTFSAHTAYTADRWQVIYDGSGATRAITQQAFSVGQTEVPNNPKFWLRFATSVAGTGGTFVAITQKIEGVRSFAGKTITMSIWLKASSNTGFSGTGQQVFGSGGSYSSVVGFQTYPGLTATTTWQKYIVTIQVPSISGKVIGTNNDDYLLFAINFYPNTTFTFDIAQVQVEEGQRATPFEVRPYQVELQLCQRYGYTIPDVAQNFFGFTHLTTTQVGLVISHPVTMRIGPTVSLISGSLANMLIQTPQSTNLSPTTVTEATTTISHTTLLFGGLSGLAIGNTVLVRFRHNGVTTLFFNSEL